MPAPRRPSCPRAAAGAAPPRCGPAPDSVRAEARLERAAADDSLPDRRADGCGLRASFSSRSPSSSQSSSSSSSSSARAAAGPARPRAGALLLAGPGGPGCGYAGRGARGLRGGPGCCALGALGERAPIVFRLPGLPCPDWHPLPSYRAVGPRWARAPLSGTISRVEDGGPWFPRKRGRCL